jgi:very-short-patch-repair endonuclease
MLVLEIDGAQHGEKVQKDETRTAYIEGEGFRVLRFWNSEILENLEGVLEVISKALRDGKLPT